MQYSRPLESRADLVRWAPTFLAGQFGELVLHGFAGPGASQDNAMVMEQIQAHIDDDSQRRMTFQRAYQQAMEIVWRQEANVRSVAEALLARETLTRDEVNRLVIPTEDPLL